jgi:hypothetical protein
MKMAPTEVGIDKLYSVNLYNLHWFLMATFCNSNIATIPNMDGLISEMESGRIVIDLYNVVQMNVECGEGDEGQRQSINIKRAFTMYKVLELVPGASSYPSRTESRTRGTVETAKMSLCTPKVLTENFLTRVYQGCN